MPDVIQNAASATVTTGGLDAPVSGTVQTFVVTTNNVFPILGTNEVMRCIDAADLGLTTNYEIIGVTVTHNGTGVNWTVTRGYEGTTPHVHAADWTIIPVLSSDALDQRFVLSGNPKGITTALQTPDGVSGTDAMQWVKFPSDASVMAWGIAGDSFPRMVFSAGGQILFGDGTFDPVSYGLASIDIFPGTYTGNILHIPKALQINNGAFQGQGAGDPNTNFGGTAGDIGDLVTSATNVGGYPTLWRCVTNGTVGVAVWHLVSVLATTDPVSAGFTPPNAGVLWQDTTGGGSAWISTGTSLGNWTQLSTAAFPTHTGNGSPNGVVSSAVGTSYLDTTHGALYWKIGGGTGNTGWMLGDFSTAATAAGDVGFALSSTTGSLVAFAGSAQSITITDLGAWNGSGDAWQWNPTAAADGSQIVRLLLGSAHQFAWIWDQNGNTIMPGPVITTPPSSKTATAAFGGLHIGVQKLNPLGYDVLVNISVPVTAATGGEILVGVGPTLTSGSVSVDPITPALTGAQTITFSQYLPANYNIIVDTFGSINTGTPVVQVSPA